MQGAVNPTGRRAVQQRVHLGLEEDLRRNRQLLPRRLRAAACQSLLVVIAPAAGWSNGRKDMQ